MKIPQLASKGRGPGAQTTAGTETTAAAKPATCARKSSGLALLALAALVALVSVGCFRLTHSLSVLNSSEVEIKVTGLLDPEFFPVAQQLEQLEINTRRSLADDLSEERRRWSGHQDADRLLDYLDQISLEVATFTDASSADASGWIGVELSAVSPRMVPEDLVGIETRLFSRSVVPDLGNMLELGDVTQLSQTSGGWEFRLDLLDEHELSLSELSELPEALAAFGTMAELLSLTEGLDDENYPEVFFSVTLPGELERSTADDVVTRDGFTTASWQIFPLDNVLIFLGEGLVLETTVDEGGFPLWLLLVLVGLGVLLLLVLVPRSLFGKLMAGWGAAKADPAAAADPTAAADPAAGAGAGEDASADAGLGANENLTAAESAEGLGTTEVPEQEQPEQAEPEPASEQPSDHGPDPEQRGLDPEQL